MRMGKMTPHKALTSLALLLSLALLALVALPLAARLTTPAWLQTDDTTEYWIAGRLNLAGRDPWDRAAVARLQLAVGRTYARPVLMCDPPWFVSVAMVLGALPYPVARVLWLVVNAALFLAAGDLLWRVYGGERGRSVRQAQDRRWVAWVATFGFLPVVVTLRWGHSTGFVVFGAALFLWGVNGWEHLVWAGVGAALMATKPHLVWMFWPVLLAWMWENRPCWLDACEMIDLQAWLIWRVPVGLVVVLGIMTVTSLLPNTNLIANYWRGIIQQPPLEWRTETIGGDLRALFGPAHTWLQFAPMLPGLVWLAWYWRRHHDWWYWPNRLPVLLLASLIFAPYGWAYDLAVALPVVVAVVAQGPGWLAILGLALVGLVSRWHSLTLGAVVLAWWYWRVKMERGRNA